MKPMKNKTKRAIVRGVATTVSVGAPFAATLSQFPIWVDKGSEATISGCFLILAFLCCIPFIRQIKAYMKSPSAPVVWAVFLVLFVCLRKIVDQMTMVCAVGLISNLIGMGLYKLGDHIGKKPDAGDSEDGGDGNSGSGDGGGTE